MPAVFEELDPSMAASILRTRTKVEAAAVLDGMDPDDATDLVANLPRNDAEQILVRMRPEDGAEIRELSAYPRESAGGVMTPGSSRSRLMRRTGANAEIAGPDRTHTFPEL